MDGVRVVPSYGGPIISHVSYHRQWLGECRTLEQYHLPSFRDGHVAGLPIHVDSFDEVGLLMTEISESQNVFRLCATRQEIEDANSRGEIALLLAPSFVAIGDRLDRLITYKALGAVMFPLSLNTRNMLADGCGERQASGLSHLGVQAVQMLNHLGIVIDVSHLSERAFWDCLAISSEPVIASHSNARAICDNPRNLTDEQARAIAEKGGCIGVSVHPSMLADESPSIADYVRHVLHFISIAGEDHVMLGADFIDYQIEFMLPKLRPGARLGIYKDSHVRAPDLSGFADLTKVVSALKAANLGPEVVNKIAGSNFLRVIETSVRLKGATHGDTQGPCGSNA